MVLCTARRCATRFDATQRRLRKRPIQFNRNSGTNARVPMKTADRILLAAPLCLLLTTLSTRAGATRRLPPLIYHHLYSSYTVAPYQPPCSLCHLRGSTGAGTADTPFALSMKARGLSTSDNTSVVTALDAMVRDKVDSDGDGTADIQEIENDTDPNSPANVSLSGDTGPKAGCGGGQTSNSGGPTPAAGVGLLFAVVLAASRRRVRRS